MTVRERIRVWGPVLNSVTRGRVLHIHGGVRNNNGT